MGNNRFQLNPGKTECFWVLNLLYMRFIILSSEWSCTAPNRHIANSGSLLDSQFLLKEQGAVVARRAFAQLHAIYQYTSCWTWRLYVLITSQMDYCNTLYMWLLMKTCRRFSHMKHGNSGSYLFPKNGTWYVSAQWAAMVTSWFGDQIQGTVFDI